MSERERQWERERQREGERARARGKKRVSERAITRPTDSKYGSALIIKPVSDTQRYDIFQLIK